MDPFTLVYNELWKILEDHEGLADLVRQGNRIKFSKETGDHDPRRSIVDHGSTPELMILPDFFTADMHFDNVQSTLDRRWSIVIRTSYRMLNKGLFPVEYQLFLALKQAQQDLKKLKFNGNNLVRHTSLERGSSRLPDVDKTHNNPMNVAWFSIWTLTTGLNL